MLLVPIGDVNEEGQHHTSFVNIGLLVTCFLVFGYELYLLGQSQEQLDAFLTLWTYDPQKELGTGFLALSKMERVGALLSELMNLSKGAFVKMATAAFLHGGLFHLLPNMFALWMLGDNVEYVMGHVRYFIFVLLTAVLATCGQMLFATPENFNGIIGASGFIFGVGAAYLVYFPGAKINFFYWFFFVFWGVKPISARFMIGLYFLSQVVTSIGDFGSNYGQVAVWAHVWGFLSGFILCFPFRKGRDEKHADYEPKPAVLPYSKTPLSPRNDGGGWGKPEAGKPASPWGNRPTAGDKSKFSKKNTDA